jgi:hypothetical protein
MLMTGSFYDLLQSLLALASPDHLPGLLGTILSLVFMAAMFLSRFIVPLLSVLAPDEAPSLRSTATKAAIALALACAAWFLPNTFVQNGGLTQLLMFAVLVVALSAVAVIMAARLIGGLLKAALAHSAAAVVPEHPAVPAAPAFARTVHDTARAVDNSVTPQSPIDSARPLIETLFANGWMVPIGAVFPLLLVSVSQRSCSGAPLN